MGAKHRKVVVLGYRGVGKTSLVSRQVNDEFPDVYSPTIENNYQTTVSLRSHEYSLQVVDTAGQDELSLIPSMFAVNVDAYVLVYSVQSSVSFRVVQSIYNRLISTVGLLPGRFPIVLVANKIDLKLAPELNDAEPSPSTRLIQITSSKSSETVATTKARVSPTTKSAVSESALTKASSCRWSSSPNESLSTATTRGKSDELLHLIPRAVTTEAGRQLADSWNAAYVETSALDDINVSRVFDLIAERLKEADDGQYLISSIGAINGHRGGSGGSFRRSGSGSRWGRRKPKPAGNGGIGPNKGKGSSWWRRLSCTSSTALSES